MPKHDSALYCCCCDLTLATRWIGFCGLALFTALTTILINDKLSNDYEYSRNTALALGLDWQHFHSTANATQPADPDGKLISIIMVFYSVAYLLTNMVLIFASITDNKWCTVPWLIFEFFGCISKVIAMVVHQLNGHTHFRSLYYIGSNLYIVIGLWWCLIVYSAQRKWSTSREISLISPQKDCISLSRIDTLDDFHITMEDSRNSYRPMLTHVDSPIAYEPNSLYSQI